MAKFFGNLHLVLAVGLLLAIAVMMQWGGSAPVDLSSVTRWLHTFFGVLWIGLLIVLPHISILLLSLREKVRPG